MKFYFISNLGKTLKKKIFVKYINMTKQSPLPFSKSPNSAPTEYPEENILITLTIFSVEQTLIQWLATEFILELCKSLKYYVKLITTGKHVHASRPHYHIMFAVSTNRQKTYKGEGLKSKIHREAKLIGCSNKEIDLMFKKIVSNGSNFKVSFVKENEPKKFKKKQINYGIEAMRYPFKEYTENDQIEINLQQGFSTAELYAMRESANMEWRIVRKKQNDEALTNIAKKEEFENEREYLKTHLDNYIITSTDDTIRHTMDGIWKYTKIMYQKNRIQRIQYTQVANRAINFLVLEGYLDHNEIIIRDRIFR
jgi:hypothetical protein